MSTKSETRLDGTKAEPRRLKFSLVLTSPIAKVTVGKVRDFYLHSDLLFAESEAFLKSLRGGFKETAESAVTLDDEDPDLFGFFVEYLYRDRSILSREVKRDSEYVTLARLYAMGERLTAPKFQAYCLWRFAQSLSTNTTIFDENICELLRIASTEITERVREDPMRSQIFWYGGTKITNLQKFDMFRQLLCVISDLGKQLCLWVGKSQPNRPAQPNELQYQRFEPESEFDLQQTLATDSDTL